MKAAILTELNKPLVVADISLPQQLSFGQVRVKILAAGFAGPSSMKLKGPKARINFCRIFWGMKVQGSSWM